MPDVISVQEPLQEYPAFPLFDPMSHCSGASMMPLPQSALATSFVHTDEHPSLFTRLPSSHCSLPSMTRLPQSGIVRLSLQVGRQCAPGTHEFWEPSSHSSPVLMTPLPQMPVAEEDELLDRDELELVRLHSAEQVRSLAVL